MIQEVREHYDEDFAMFGVRNETYPQNSDVEIYPYFSIHRHNSIVDTFELDSSKIDDYTTEWMVNYVEKDVLRNKYFMIIDNPAKARNVNFNDGFNYLVLHLFEDFAFYKFYADKETIENFTIQYIGGEGRGRYVEIDEDYQHENILYMLYSLSFNRDLDVFGHLKVVAIKHEDAIINNINNPVIQANLRTYSRTLHGMLYEEDYGHMNRHQMLMNQKLAELEEQEEHSRTMEYFLDEPKQIQLAAQDMMKKEPSPIHKKKHNPDPTALYEYKFNLFLYEPSEEKEDDQIKYMPQIMASSLYRIKVWVLSEIGPHFYEDDIAHNSLYLIQGTMYYKFLVVLYPETEYGLQVKNRVKEFSVHYDKNHKAKYDHELHSEKYYDFLKAYDDELIIIAHPLNKHHFTQTMTYMLGYQGEEDYKQPHIFIMEHAMHQYNKYIYDFENIGQVSDEGLMKFVNDYKERKLTKVMKSEDCQAFESTHFDHFERTCGTSMFEDIRKNKKLTIVIVDNYYCEYECMKRWWVIKHFKMLNEKRQTNPKYTADKWEWKFIDYLSNDIDGLQFYHSLPHTLFYIPETDSFEKFMIGPDMDVICALMNFYGYLPDFSLDIYESDKKFGKKMRKYFDDLRLEQRDFLLANHDFDKIAKELQFHESESIQDIQLDEMHDFLREFDEIVNHNYDDDEDVEDYKGRRHKQKNRFSEMDLEYTPIEKILYRWLKEEGELPEEEYEEQLEEDEEWEYYDDEKGEWIRDSVLKSKDTHEL
eukprot:Mrub_00854.p1 GENE.Mrub_00854~~Mrub_00854.p1  ORF type:complete len:836 (-),score=138.10 Mrub_00854:124-2400(-)